MAATFIPSLRRYQRPRRVRRFDDLPPAQRAAAEAHFQRLCARWGDDLPQWRRAVLVGRAKDLAIRPRDGAWARGLRRKDKTRSFAPIPHTLAPHLPASTTPAHATPGSHSPVKVASSSDQVNVASSLPEPLPSPTPRPHDVRLDISGITTTGTDGHNTVQRILRDVEHWTLGQSPRFSMVIPGKDLPRRWAWRLVVIAVP